MCSSVLAAAEAAWLCSWYCTLLTANVTFVCTSSDLISLTIRHNSDGAYSVFAGREATIGLARGNFDIEEKYDLDELSMFEYVASFAHHRNPSRSINKILFRCWSI